MASALQIVALLSALIGTGFCAISPLTPADIQGNSVTTQAPWAPATQPREFGYQVADGILGANQLRHEVWKNGTMSGMYAYPLGANQWQVVDYVADAQGFRVTNSKVVSESELMAGHQASPQTASVDIDRDGSKTSYSVKASDLNQKLKQQQKQPQSGKGSEQVPA